MLINHYRVCTNKTQNPITIRKFISWNFYILIWTEATVLIRNSISAMNKNGAQWTKMGLAGQNDDNWDAYSDIEAKSSSNSLQDKQLRYLALYCTIAYTASCTTRTRSRSLTFLELYVLQHNIQLVEENSLPGILMTLI